MSSQLDSDAGLAVEVLEAVDREIASLLLLIKSISPDSATLFSAKLAVKRAQREQLSVRFIAAAQLLQQRADRSPGKAQWNDHEVDA
jgi:hypothetical protein